MLLGAFICKFWHVVKLISFTEKTKPRYHLGGGILFVSSYLKEGGSKLTHIL